MQCANKSISAVCQQYPDVVLICIGPVHLANCVTQCKAQEWSQQRIQRKMAKSGLNWSNSFTLHTVIVWQYVVGGLISAQVKYDLQQPIRPHQSKILVRYTMHILGQTQQNYCVKGGPSELRANEPLETDGDKHKHLGQIESSDKSHLLLH